MWDAVVMVAWLGSSLALPSTVLAEPKVRFEALV